MDTAWPGLSRVPNKDFSLPYLENEPGAFHGQTMYVLYCELQSFPEWLVQSVETFLASSNQKERHWWDKGGDINPLGNLPTSHLKFNIQDGSLRSPNTWSDMLSPIQWCASLCSSHNVLVQHFPPSYISSSSSLSLNPEAGRRRKITEG